MDETSGAPRAPVTFGREARSLFAIDPDWAFLNNGSFGAPPRSVLAAQDAIRARLERQPVAMFHEFRDRMPGVRARLGAFLGARGQDLALVENATAGCNAVLRSLRFGAGDELLTTSHVYGAVRQTLRHVAKTSGATLIEAPTPWPAVDAASIVAAVAGAITPRTRILVIDHIASRSALVFPLAAIVAEAKAKSVPVLVDGAHAPGQIPLDVPALDADWYVGNCHKWLFAGKGCGFLWAAPHARAELQPPVISHDYEDGFPDSFDWIGTRDPSAWLTLPDALDFGDAIGWDRIRAHNDALAASMGAMLAKRWGTELGAAPSLRAAMATIRVPGRNDASDEAGRALRAKLWSEHRIEAPIGPFDGALWVRISAQIWNHEDEYARLAAALTP